jgi:PAS domain S-box-containing protein
MDARHAPDDARTEATRFAGFMGWASLVALAIGAIVLVVGVLAGSRWTIAGSGLLLLVSLVFAWVRGAARRGRLAQTALVTSATLIALSPLAVLLLPPALPLLVVLVIGAVALALPYLPAERLRRLIVTACVVLCTLPPIALLAPATALDPLLAWVLPLLLAGIGALAMLLFWRHQQRIEALLAQTRAACDDLETEMRARTAELREREARWQAFSELTSDFVFSLRMATPGDLRLEWGTEEAFARITGYGADEFEALGGWEAIIRPEQRPAWEQHLRELRAGQPSTLEFAIQTKAGATRWLRSSVRPEFDADGMIVRLLGASQDITEQKRAELALRQSEERFRTLLDLAPIGVAITRDGRMLYCNRTLVKMSGYSSPAELADIPLSRLVAPEERMRQQERIRKRRAGERVPASYESVGLRRDGVRIPIWVESGVIDLPDGPAVVAFITDLRERLRAEEERLRLERQLAAAQKLESLGVLAGGVAHDFNNLLTAILGNVAIALDDLPSDSPAREPVEQIEITARRAGELTRQLLSFAARGRRHTEPLALNDLADEMVAMLRPSIHRTTALELDLAADLPLIDGDGTQIRQVLMNLIINAAEAIQGSGRITVRTALLPGGAALDGARIVPNMPAAAYACLEVADSGCGMDDATLGRIFDPFFSTKSAGHGLGLPSVLDIVRAHNGAITIWSAPGEGTIFRVMFPVAEAAALPSSRTGRLEEETAT